MQSRSGDQEQLKQSSEQQLVPRAFQNPRDAELVEMPRRAVVTKSRSHLVLSDRTAVTFRLDFSSSPDPAATPGFDALSL